MKVSLTFKVPKSESLFVFLPEKKWGTAVAKTFGKTLSKEIQKEIAEHTKHKDFKGEIDEVFRVFPGGKKSGTKVFLVGLGKSEEALDVRKVGATAIGKAKALKTKTVTFLVPQGVDVSRLAHGAIVGAYEFKLGDTKKQFFPTSLTLVTSGKVNQKAFSSAVAVGEATNHVRDLVNLPPNKMTPKLLANEAKVLSKKHRSVRVKVLGEAQMKKLKMGMFLGVGQGSVEESQMALLEYKGGKRSQRPIVLIGKGVCFDSGGYNLKPTRYIEDMKSDMAGAATVLGVFEWIAKHRPKVNVIGIMGAVENLVSGDAFKAGDILTSMSGKTVEITNTDAEGRLVLGDCLHYACTKYRPGGIIDLATLTGSVIAATGNEISGAFTNDAAFLEALKKATESSDEKIWELPLNKRFSKMMEGSISDLINCDLSREAGASTAAAFLQEFVKKDIPWIHLDIAGTAFRDKPLNQLSPKGASGEMVSTLCELLKNW